MQTIWSERDFFSAPQAYNLFSSHSSYYSSSFSSSSSLRYMFCLPSLRFVSCCVDVVTKRWRLSIYDSHTKTTRVHAHLWKTHTTHKIGPVYTVFFVVASLVYAQFISNPIERYNAATSKIWLKNIVFFVQRGDLEFKLSCFEKSG